MKESQTRNLELYNDQLLGTPIYDCQQLGIMSNNQMGKQLKQINIYSWIILHTEGARSHNVTCMAATTG